MKPTYEELAAQVALIKHWHEDCGKLPDTTAEMKKLERLLAKTPAACLAQVKDDNLREFVNYVIDNDLSNTLEAAAFQFGLINKGDKP